MAVNVNGCFWHQHQNCKNATLPKNNADFWQEKLNRTIERDNRNKTLLQEAGWQEVTIWECEIEKDIVKAVAPLLDALQT